MPYTQTIDTATLNARYNAEASEFYRKKMESLIDHDREKRHRLRGYIPDRLITEQEEAKEGEQTVVLSEQQEVKRENERETIRVELPSLLMYRIDTRKSQDGQRIYEFLIEYDIDSPSIGIYYGCRGVTTNGADHTESIEQFRKDREAVLPELVLVLNNTFPNKDFSHRFKLTDNAQDGTYWLFWVTLNEEEDIRKVGVTATHIMSNVFAHYLKGDPMATTPPAEKRFENEVIWFTEETYKAFIESVKFLDGDKKVDPDKTKEARELAVRFVHAAERQKATARDPNYEKAWRVQDYSDAEFARLMYALFDYLHDRELICKAFKTEEKKQTINVPWQAICKVFIGRDGKAYNRSIGTQVNKHYHYEQDIKKYKNLIQSWLE